MAKGTDKSARSAQLQSEIEHRHQLDTTVRLLKHDFDAFCERYEHDQLSDTKQEDQLREEFHQFRDAIDERLNQFIKENNAALQKLIVHAERWKTGLAIILALGTVAGWVIGSLDNIRAIAKGVFGGQ